MANALLKQLYKTWPWTVGSSVVAFIATMVAVRIAGLAVFANYSIDLAKLSIVFLVVELVPSSFSILQQQIDSKFKSSLPVHYWAALCIVPGLVWLLNFLSLFSAFSSWMYLYACCNVLQMYLDARLQAEGNTKNFFALPFVANATRLIFLLGVGVIYPGIGSNQIIWCALSCGLLTSLCVFFSLRPVYLLELLRVSLKNSTKYIWSLRTNYYQYYSNVALKRLRDIAIPLLCDSFVPNRREIGRYLLAFRGIDFVCGQLRVIENLMTNLVARSSLNVGRERTLTSVALAGQCIGAVMSLALLAQEGIGWPEIQLVLTASFLVYPYVFEIVGRGDAYAAGQPIRVTYSLIGYLGGSAATITCCIATGSPTANGLILAPIIGQGVSALTYRMWEK